MIVIKLIDINVTKQHKTVITTLLNEGAIPSFIRKTTIMQGRHVKTVLINVLKQ